MELVVSQLDKRMGIVGHKLMELSTEMGQLRTEVFAELRELRTEIRSNFRWTLTPMIALFWIAVPVWMGVLGYIIKGI